MQPVKDKSQSKIQAAEEVTLTTQQAADRRSVQPDRIRKLVKEGRLPAKMVKGDYRFRVSDVDAIPRRGPGRPPLSGTSTGIVKK